MIMVMGDLNAKVGNNNTDGEEVVGRFGVDVMNDKGERSCDIHNLDLEVTRRKESKPD